MDIKPIETIYNGYRFRSRLEARWAVFFDELCVQYEYEAEGYPVKGWPTNKPIFYLPDFHLRELQMWIEVKSTHEALQVDLEKIIRFSHDVGPIAHLVGGPDPFQPIGGILYAGDSCESGGGFSEWPFRFIWCQQHHRAEIAAGDERHTIVNPIDWSEMPICLDSIDEWSDFDNDPEIKEAALAARQARFEYGANGR